MGKTSALRHKKSHATTDLRVALSGKAIRLLGRCILDHSDLAHPVRRPDDRAIGATAAFDRINHIHAFGDFAHNGILTVEEIARVKHDEELRIAAIGVLRTRHANIAVTHAEMQLTPPKPFSPRLQIY